ncbi:MAG: hypothetical protein K6E50_13345 [Lachnospiraceae bacterium]|nr:hypothetical protein [Lachnospiraceae bacterium]
MNRKGKLWIIILLDIVLGLVFFKALIGASEELSWVYIEKGGIRPDDILSYLDRKDYGTVAIMARSYRIGSKVRDEDEELYLMGEYADLLFYERIFAEDGQTEEAADFEKRRGEIRGVIPEYESVLDDMDQGIEKGLHGVTSDE